MKQNPGGKTPGKGRPGNGNGQGSDGNNRPGRDCEVSPEQLAQRMIRRHDKDGDGALNVQELTQLFTARGEGRHPGNGQGPGGRHPGGGQGPNSGSNRPEQGQRRPGQEG